MGRVIADVGTLLTVDYITETKTKLKFVKGIAAVNLNKLLIQEVMLESVDGLHRQFINYDFLAEACFICGDPAHQCRSCPFAVNQRQLFLEHTSTQRARAESGGSQPKQACHNMNFTEWVPVPPTHEEAILGILSSGMERMGLSKGGARSMGKASNLERKPPVRFVVKPGQEDVVAEFTEFNSETRTRSMATTSLRFKAVTAPFSFGFSGLAGPKYGMRNPFGNLQQVSWNEPFTFGVNQGGSGRSQQLWGTGGYTQKEANTIQASMVDAIRLAITTEETTQKKSSMVTSNSSTEGIVLASLRNLETVTAASPIDPLNDYKDMENDDEGSANDNFEDLDSVASSEISFFAKMATLNNSIILPEDQPSQHAPKAIINHKKE